MPDVVKFSCNIGTAEFDFDERVIRLERSGSLAGSMRLTSMTIDFDDITDVELRPPKMLTPPAFCFIINGKRLMTTANINATQFMLNKVYYSQVAATLERLVRVCNLSGIKEYERPSVPKEVYTPGTTQGALFTIRNNSGSVLDVFETYIELNHQNLISTLAMSGNKGKKRISLFNLFLQLNSKKHCLGKLDISSFQ